MNEVKIKKVFSKKLALELRRLGCKIIGVEPNTSKPELNVYLFEDCEHLSASWMQAIENAKSNSKDK